MISNAGSPQFRATDHRLELTTGRGAETIDTRNPNISRYTQVELLYPPGDLL